jgi:hypothetical protein
VCGLTSRAGGKSSEGAFLNLFDVRENADAADFAQEMNGSEDCTKTIPCGGSLNKVGCVQPGIGTPSPGAVLCLFTGGVNI